MKIDPVLSVMLAMGAGVIGKIVFDWLSTRGQAEKGVYVTVTRCNEVRKECGFPQAKSDMSVMSARLDETEKKLDQGREDFRLLRDDISGIKESLAGIQAVLESAVKKRIQNEPLQDRRTIDQA